MEYFSPEFIVICERFNLLRVYSSITKAETRIIIFIKFYINSHILFSSVFVRINLNKQKNDKDKIQINVHLEKAEG